MATHMYSGWGVRFFDFDQDGDPDLVVCNGHPDDRIEEISSTLTHREPLLLFENDSGRFRSLGARAGEAFGRSYPGRGLGVGDLDNDGYPDVVVAGNGDAPMLLRNTGASRNRFIGLRLVGTRANRDAVGARVAWSAGGRERAVQRNGGGSYLSSDDPRVLLGLGAAERADWIEVRWPAPSARVDRFGNVAAGRYYLLREGEGLR
jgi:hypothetical protein